MNASLISSLVRMGLAVGAHLEHPVSLQQIDGMAKDLAVPVIQALGADEVVRDPDGPIAADGRALCWHGWRSDSGDCPGGCRCVLDRHLVHGAALRAADDHNQVPHVCRRGHTYRFVV